MVNLLRRDSRDGPDDLQVLEKGWLVQRDIVTMPLTGEICTLQHDNDDCAIIDGINQTGSLSNPEVWHISVVDSSDIKMCVLDKFDDTNIIARQSAIGATINKCPFMLTHMCAFATAALHCRVCLLVLLSVDNDFAASLCRACQSN